MVRSTVGLVLLFVAMWGTACPPKDQGALPVALGELRLHRTVTGEEARSIINRMHSKGVTPETNSIGEYGSEGHGSAALYVSRYNSSDDAVNAERIMRALIAAGNETFTGYREFMVSGHRVSMCNGLGQTHYFFAHREALYWLSADQSIVLEVLQDLLKGLSPREEMRTPP